MTIQIGRFNIPLIFLSGAIPFLLAAIIIQFVIKDKVQRKFILNKLSNILFLGFISWKLTPLITSFDTIIDNPSSILFLTGGKIGEIVALILSSIYVVFELLKNRQNRPLIYFISIYLFISISLFFSINNFSTNSLEDKQIVEISNLTLQHMDREIIGINLDSEKPIILNFWATWCPPCKAEIPDLVEFYTDYGNDVDFYGIDLIETEKDNISHFIDSYNINYPIYLDIKNKVSNYFDIQSVPTTIIITQKDGELFIEKISGVVTKETLKSLISKS